MGKVIGIDLGTTNSCVAMVENGEPVIVPSSTGARTTPSVVAFSKYGERLIGDVARRQLATNAERTICSVPLTHLDSAIRRFSWDILTDIFSFIT